MTVLLWWMEPLAPGAVRRRRRISDWIIGFAVAAMAALGIVGPMAPTRSLAVGNGFELSVPSQPWQYGLAMVITVLFGFFGVWIMSFGGRAEVSMREGDIYWLLGRSTGRAYAYARMEHCRIERVSDGDYWRLRISMKPEPTGKPASDLVLTMPGKIDVQRVRAIMQARGVATSVV